MADNVADGPEIRVLTIVDNFSRECVALEVATGFNGAAVAAVLTRAVRERAAPRFIRCDNGPEFSDRAMLLWGGHRNINLHFIDPGKPVT